MSSEEIETYILLNDISELDANNLRVQNWLLDYMRTFTLNMKVALSNFQKNIPVYQKNTKVK